MNYLGLQTSKSFWKMVEKRRKEETSSLKDLQKLNSYRSFRHVFRNVYGFDLSFNRIKGLLELLPDTSASIKKDLDNFIYQMEINYEIDK